MWIFPVNYKCHEGMKPKQSAKFKCKMLLWKSKVHSTKNVQCLSPIVHKSRDDFVPIFGIARGLVASQPQGPHVQTSCTIFRVALPQAVQPISGYFSGNGNCHYIQNVRNPAKPNVNMKNGRRLTHHVTNDTLQSHPLQSSCRKPQVN